MQGGGLSLTGPPLDGPVSTPALLRRSLVDAPALVTADARLTWAELHRASHGLAAGWRDLGLRPGSRVASLMPNRPELLVHDLACLQAGLVATPLKRLAEARLTGGPGRAPA